MKYVVSRYITDDKGAIVFTHSVGPLYEKAEEVEQELERIHKAFQLSHFTFAIREVPDKPEKIESSGTSEAKNW